jgi:hypothetical protein
MQCCFGTEFAADLAARNPFVFQASENTLQVL